MTFLFLILRDRKRVYRQFDALLICCSALSFILLLSARRHLPPRAFVWQGYRPSRSSRPSGAHARTSITPGTCFRRTVGGETQSFPRWHVVFFSLGFNAVACTSRIFSFHRNTPDGKIKAAAPTYRLGITQWLTPPPPNPDLNSRKKGGFPGYMLE